MEGLETNSQRISAAAKGLLLLGQRRECECWREGPENNGVGGRHVTGGRAPRFVPCRWPCRSGVRWHCAGGRLAVWQRGPAPTELQLPVHSWLSAPNLAWRVVSCLPALGFLSFGGELSNTFARNR